MTRLSNSMVGLSGDMSVSQPAARNDFLSVVRRRSSVFIRVSFITYALVLIALFVIPVRYVATGSVIVAEQTLNVDTTLPIGVDKVGDPADVESQILLIRAPRLLRVAAERPDVQAAITQECEERSRGLVAGILGGAGTMSCQNPLQDQNALVEQLQLHFSVSAAGRSRVINIAYDSPLASVAQTMANALTTVYLADRRTAWAATNKTSAISLRQELQDLSQSLHADEDRIRSFRNRNGLIRGSIAPIGSERLSNISQTLISAEAAKSEAAARMEEIQRAEKTNIVDSPLVMGNRTIGDLKQQLTVLDIEYARVSAILGPRHPSILSLEQARDVLKGRIGAELQTVVAGARKTYETASALVTSLRQKMRSFETEALSAEDEETAIADLVRIVEAKKARYVDLSKQITRIETQTPAYSDSTKLVSLAELPTTPYFPKRQPFLLGGLVLALLLGGGAVLMLERMDSSPRPEPATAPAPIPVMVPVAAPAPPPTAAVPSAPMEVEQVAASPQAGLPMLAPGLPMLGQIPLIGATIRQMLLNPLRRRGSGISLASVLQRGWADPGFQAAIGDLVGVMVTSGHSDNVKTVVITSALPGEGRTITTLALGFGLAAAGLRTLIIESDFQNPCMSDVLRLKKTRGLAGLLQNDTSIEAAIVPTTSPDLFVIPVGRRTFNATPEMASAKMAELLVWARQFDHVLIDTPAHSVTRDALALAQMVDAVLCCTRSGTAEGPELAATVRDLTASGGKVLGAVVTMVGPTRRPLVEPHA